MNLTILQEKLTLIYRELNQNNLPIIRQRIKDTLKLYDTEDWKIYVKKCESTYHRKLLYSSPEYDLVIITWCKDQGCAIHNHPENGCTVKILQNHITEELYDADTLKLCKSSTYEKDDIMYIDDTIGYHRMCNKCDEPCVSLHVYAPGKYKPKFFSKKSD
jgi:hypothetical protein